MSLGREIGLSPSDIVLDGDPAPHPQKGVEPPIFGPCVLWPDGCMDQDGTWRRAIDLGPVHIVLDGDPAPLPQKGAEPPNFRRISVVAKWLDGSRCHLVGR